MKNGTLITCLPEELQAPIITAVRLEINRLKDDFKPKEPEVYLTRNQLAEMLHVDISTIHNMRKKGIITAYQISGRVLFKRSEIEASIIELNL